MFQGLCFTHLSGKNKSNTDYQLILLKGNVSLNKMIKPIGIGSF